VSAKVKPKTKAKAKPKAKPKVKPKTKPKAKPKTKTKPRVKPTAHLEEEKQGSSCGCYFYLLLLIAGLAYFAYKNKEEWRLTQYFTPKVEERTFIPDPVSYENLKTHLASERAQLRNRFLNARSLEEQAEVVNQAGDLLEHTMPQMMRCWLGHPWDFNGMATIPGEGKIACGYFVAVIMRDAGFKVNRIKLAQQPSQQILKTFLPSRKDLWITGGMPYEEYTDKIESDYEGINIVGLDNHVAFVVVNRGEMRFIHSGGLKRRVVDEEKPKAYSLEVSNYRVIGNITRNRDLLEKWILGDDLPTAR